MRKPSYRMIIVALAATVFTPPLSAFAQQGSDQQNQQLGTPRRPTATAEPTPPPQEPHHTFYYPPGDNEGVPYETTEECSQVRQRDGNVGVCVEK
jgi:hypothetical protein